MKVLYVGDFIKGNGPSTVDMSLRKRFELSDSNSFSYLQSNGRLNMRAIKLLMNVSVIHVSGVSFLGTCLMLLGKVLRKKMSMTMHGSLVCEVNYRKVPKKRLLIEALQLRLADRVFPVSSLLAKLIKSKKIVVIPNGFIRSFNLSSDKQDNFITLIGGGRREKRHLEVCQVIRNLNYKYNLDIKVNLYGEIGSDTEILRKHSFLTDHGFCSKEVVNQALSESKIFIQYSTFESFSLAVGEALNFGCKIITSDQVGINDFIETSNSYKIVKDEKELEDSLYNMLKDTSEFKIVEHLLTWDEVAKEYNKNWNDL